MEYNYDFNVESLINEIGSGYEKKYKDLKFKLTNENLFSKPSSSNSYSLNHLLSNNSNNESQNAGNLN